MKSTFNFQVGHFINPDYVKLHESRGTEDYHHKIFMRNSVLLMDLLIFIPATVIFVKLLKSSQDWQMQNLAMFLVYPGLILIDHGHFQYNNVSLGLFILSVGLILQNRILWASMTFILALSYKQMELYHALPFFFYLLGLCLRKEPNWSSAVTKLIKIGTVVILTFCAVWWPFLQDFDQLKQVLVRIFPLNRGLFEDKVSNVWCTVNVIYKLKEIFDQQTLAMVSAAITLLGKMIFN